MSSPFAFLLSATRKAKKQALEHIKLQRKCGMISDDADTTELFEQLFQKGCKEAIQEIELMKKMQSMIAEPFGELMSGTASTPKTYFITIRPDDSKVTFELFKAQVDKLLSRACFKKVFHSFEQKGISESDLGKGFHVHIVAEMSQRSKSEVLRDVLSTFNQWIQNGLIAPNCIEVCITKNGDKLIKDYLIDYKSDDEHKEVTKPWDDMWRDKLGLSSRIDFINPP